MTVTEHQAQSAAMDKFLRLNEEKELLRLSTAGSVDDGKSTLIGRLLHDSKGVYEDQLAAVRKASVNSSAGVALDFALLTDGLRAERQQGITIDVAYRYFSTPRRKFIIADTPGHEQYTRNMATGASTANVAIILLDARKGVLPQSRRHAFIATLLGIPHLVIAVNKMDLVDYREDVFEEIRAEFSAFAARLQVSDLQFIPISALEGDNVVNKSRNMDWFDGPSLLHHLETVHIASDRNLTEMRFPVQYVVRPDQDFRGYAGQVASGVIHVGDPVLILPSGRTSRVKSIVSFDGNLPKAFPPMGVTVCLEGEQDVSRGDMLVSPTHVPHVSRHIDARLVWMNEKPLQTGREYFLKHTTQTVRATLTNIRYRMNIQTLDKEDASLLALNEIGAAVFQTNRPVFFDPYRRNRATGSFILIDPITNETVGAGMITGRPPRETAELAEQAQSRVTHSERELRLGHKPAIVWLPGNAELAYLLERRLFDRNCAVQVFEDAAEAPTLLALTRVALGANLLFLCAPPSATAETAEAIKQVAGAERFIEPTLTNATDEAVDQLCRLLEQKAIIPAAPDLY